MGPDLTLAGSRKSWFPVLIPFRERAFWVLAIPRRLSTCSSTSDRPAQFGGWQTGGTGTINLFQDHRYARDGIGNVTSITDYGLDAGGSISDITVWSTNSAGDLMPTSTQQLTATVVYSYKACKDEVMPSAGDTTIFAIGLRVEG